MVQIMFSDFDRSSALLVSVPTSVCVLASQPLPLRPLPRKISHSILNVPSSSSIFDNNFRVSVAENFTIFVCEARTLFSSSLE